MHMVLSLLQGNSKPDGWVLYNFYMDTNVKLILRCYPEFGEIFLLFTILLGFAPVPATVHLAGKACKR